MAAQLYQKRKKNICISCESQSGDLGDDGEALAPLHEASPASAAVDSTESCPRHCTTSPCGSSSDQTASNQEPAGTCTQRSSKGANIMHGYCSATPPIYGRTLPRTPIFGLRRDIDNAPHPYYRLDNNGPIGVSCGQENIQVFKRVRGRDNSLKIKQLFHTTVWCISL